MRETRIGADKPNTNAMVLDTRTAADKCNTNATMFDTRTGAGERNTNAMVLGFTHRRGQMQHQRNGA